MIKKSNEEVIRLANEYMANTKIPTRTGLVEAVGVARKRVDEMVAAGLLKLPPKVSAKAKHLFSTSKWHDNFKLPNSH